MSQKKKSNKQKKKKIKEQIIKDLMEGSNFTRPQAEVAAAIEVGEIDGDVIEIDIN